MHKSDELIKELHDLIGDSFTITRSFDFKKKALETLHYIFKDVKLTEMLRMVDQIAYQSNNVMLKNFLKDTKTYLETGRRVAEINIWDQTLLISLKGQKVTGIRETGLNSLFGNEKKLIHLWLNQPNGLADLICTTRILLRFVPKS